MCDGRDGGEVRGHVGVGGGEVEAGDGQIPDVLVRVGLLYPLVLGPPVLEPDLDLSL